MPAASPPFAALPPTARSRVTNHRDLLPNIDGRSLMARRYRDIIGAVITDQGGLDRMAEARLQLCRRFAACSVLAEAMETRLVNGEAFNIGEYAQLTSTMVRVAHRIGINRTARDVTPHLDDYAIGKPGRPRAAVDDVETHEP